MNDPEDIDISAVAHLANKPSLNQTEKQTTIQEEIELDARGLNCPLPTLRAKKLLNKLTANQVQFADGGQSIYRVKELVGESENKLTVSRPGFINQQRNNSNRRDRWS